LFVKSDKKKGDEIGGGETPKTTDLTVLGEENKSGNSKTNTLIRDKEKNLLRRTTFVE